MYLNFETELLGKILVLLEFRSKVLTDMSKVRISPGISDVGHYFILSLNFYYKWGQNF